MNGWLTADYWFQEFLVELDQDGTRSSRLWRERIITLPVRDQLARDYEQKTRQLLKMLAVEGQKTEVA